MPERFRLSRRETARYAVLMLAGVALNLLTYQAALALNLPAWLDYTGTLLCAVMLEPAAGLLVGFADNFYLALTLGDPKTILYFFSSAAMALLGGSCIRRKGELRASRIPLAALAAAAGGAAASWLVRLAETGAAPNGAWELRYQLMAQNAGLPPALALLAAMLLMKLCGAAISAALLGLIYASFPYDWKQRALHQRELERMREDVINARAATEERRASHDADD